MTKKSLILSILGLSLVSSTVVSFRQVYKTAAYAEHLAHELRLAEEKLDAKKMSDCQDVLVELDKVDRSLQQCKATQFELVDKWCTGAEPIRNETDPNLDECKTVDGERIR